MNAPNATAERILDAAETRIKLTGYNAVSFRELADAVSVTTARRSGFFASLSPDQMPR